MFFFLGPLGHQFVSDLVSYQYLRAFIAAIDRIKASNVLIPIRVPDLPPPRFLNSDPFLLKLANIDDAPGCIHFEKSTFGKPQVVIADSNNDILNPYAAEVGTVFYCFQSYYTNLFFFTKSN